MARYNTSEFSIAVRHSTDALMGVPKDVLSVITRKMLDYWHVHQLEEDYPEFVEAFEEIDDLMVL
jgi:hypothetical protein